MVVIRLARAGAREPFYHVVVSEKSSKRDGRFIERLGFYNPVSRGQALPQRIDLERIDHWISVGAQMSPTVKELVKKARQAAPAA